MNYAYKKVKIPYIQYNGKNAEEIKKMANSDHIGDYRFTIGDNFIKIHGYNGYNHWTLTANIGDYVFINQQEETDVLQAEKFLKYYELA